jgi:hypothetical protein
LVTTYRSSLGNLEINQGVVYNNLPNGSITLIGTGSGVVKILGGALSTGTNTGALQVVGGIATTNDIFVNGLTIGQGYQGVNNLVIRGAAKPIPNDANIGQESIAIGYGVLNGIASSNNSIAIGYLALNSGTYLVGELAIGSNSLESLGSIPTITVGPINGITNNVAAQVSIGTHQLSSGTLITITGLTQGPVTLNNSLFYISIVNANTIALYTDNILQHPVDTSTLPGYQGGGTVSIVLPYDQNTAYGSNSGQHLLYGRQNLFLGPRSGQYLTTGSYNTLIGHDAAVSLTSGNGNVIINGDIYANNKDNQISIGAAIYYDGESLTTLSSGLRVSSKVTSTSTTTGALTVAGGISTPDHVYSADGGIYENNLLYTPRILTGSVSDIASVVPRVGDFWIDTDNFVEYQYIETGGQRFWLQIITL